MDMTDQALICPHLKLLSVWSAYLSNLIYRRPHEIKDEDDDDYYYMIISIIHIIRFYA